MFLQIAFPVEQLVADFAFKLLLVGVREIVLLQVSLLYEFLAASVAFERLYVTVDLFVMVQSESVTEAPVADVTFKRFISIWYLDGLNNTCDIVALDNGSVLLGSRGVLDLTSLFESSFSILRFNVFSMLL